MKFRRVAFTLIFLLLGTTLIQASVNEVDCKAEINRAVEIINFNLLIGTDGVDLVEIVDSSLSLRSKFESGLISCSELRQGLDEVSNFKIRSDEVAYVK